MPRQSTPKPPPIGAETAPGLVDAMGKAFSEATREREALKSLSHLSTALPSSQLSTSSDTVLTALAQLAVIRTRTSRSLISLFDAKWQHIVAEATSDMPLRPNLNHADRNGQDLWLCGTAIPRSDGICECSLAPQVCKGSPFGDLPATFVRDLQSDDRFSSKPYCAAGSPARFYASVPIRTARGIDIGVFCVIHHEPMDGDAEWQNNIADVLSTISSAIMGHFESERMKLAHRRSQRMVRGVGSFVEEASTLTDWHEGPNPSAFRDVVGMEGSLNDWQQALQHEHRKSHDADADDSRETRRSIRGASDGGIDSVHSRSQDRHRSSRSRSTGRNTPALPSDQDGGLQNIFSKAANLIRESIEVEGVVFLDADAGTFGSRVGEADINGSPATSSLANSSSDEAHSGPENGGAGRCCPVLGFSTSDTSSINNDKASRTQITLPGKVIATLLRRYPGGKIWNFDENGSLQSSDSSEDDTPSIFTPVVLQSLPSWKKDTRAKPWARQREGSNLSAIFPGARSIAFVPAWNEKTGRWHSGCFVYTFTPDRNLTTAGELSYLRAFNVLVMAEVSRLQARLEIKAQNDILNSISHELRSPLHGVILGVELIRDTSLDTFQGNIIHTVETCGRTLLDTIDHLLDFSNINNFLRIDKKQKPEKRLTGLSTIETGMKNLLVEVDLDALVEEVVESVFAGHNFQRLSIGQIDRANQMPSVDNQANSHLDCMKAMEEIGSSRKDIDTSASPSNSVSIQLDIEPDVHRYLTTIGAIRRIVMNLFGNALKYTQRGAIRVSLSRVPLSTKKHRGKQHTVRITVSDTGQGMSEDYIAHKLYKPFHQENDLSPGTGLGLSLVKGIVDSLGGEISFKSKLNVGTAVTVLLPLTPATMPPRDDSSEKTEEVFLGQKRQLKGLRVHLTDLPQMHTSIISESFLNMKPLQCASVEMVCRDWLKMEIVHGTLSCPDVVLCSETAVDNIDGLSHISGKAPIVVVCNDAVAAHSRTLVSCGYVGGRIVEFVSQPVGPRKLAKILLLAFKRWVALQGLHSPTDGFTLPTSPFTAPPTPLDLDDTPFMQRALASSQPISDVPATSPVEPFLPTLPSTPPREKHPAEFLLVDDNPVNIKILCAFMKKLGRTYGTATNGEEAVASFKANDYRCVLMDISMPKLDGMAATRLIRKHERKHNSDPATIIALTGLASASTQKEAFASGMNLVLTKPVMLKDLKNILRTENYI
ncbi:histidine kinase-like protein [Seiridium cupressi]